MSHRRPQDTYARRLLTFRGYPLWVPEPDNQLIDSERPDGLRIGDVGVVNPEIGYFDVLFNICLPPDHPFHQISGVPEGFQQVQLEDRDIRTTPNMQPSGCITSTNIEPPQAQSSGAGTLDYEFNLRPKSGALLVLPEGADHHVLRHESCFLDYAVRHGADWYRFARECRGWIIHRHALYLITGFYKAKSWSVAAYDNTTEAGGVFAKFSATQVGRDDIDIPTAYTWPTPHPSARRTGPAANYGSPNQTVFIRGFKISLSRWFLGPHRVAAKADAPNIRSITTKLSRSMRTSQRLETNNTLAGGRSASNLATGQVTRASLKAVPSASTETTHQSEVVRVFHPCDAINEYLLQQEPSANIAISHDSDWIALLETKLLTPDELAQEERLLNAVSRMYNSLSREGVIYLERKSASDASEGCSSAREVRVFKAGVLQRVVVALVIWSGIRKRIARRRQTILRAGSPMAHSVDSGIGQMPQRKNEAKQDSPLIKQNEGHIPALWPDVLDTAVN